MITSLIVKALLLPTVAGGAYLAGHGGLPTADAPPAPVAAPATAQPAGGFQIAATCNDQQDAPRAAQGPAQARKADRRTVTVQVSQAPATAPDAQSDAYQPHGQDGKPQQVTSAPQAPAADPATPAAGRGGVDLNHATHAELVDLPGVGEATATRIEHARPIAKVEDLKTMAGVTGPNYALFAGKVHV